MQHRLITLLAAALLASGCGSEEAPKPEAAPVEKAAAPAPAPQPAAAPVATAPVQPPPPPPSPQYTHPALTTQATAVIPPDAIGGTPTDMASFDPTQRGKLAIEKYCQDMKFSCESFYAKDMQEIQGAWVLQYFGTPGGNGMYVDVRVYNDGRAEIVRH
jgi:hypothetical protein